MPVTNFLPVFLHMRMLIFPVPSWGIISPDRIHGWQFFSLKIWKILHYFHLALHGFRWEVHCHLNWYSLSVMCHFSAFRNFTLLLVFRSIILTCLGMAFLNLILFSVCSVFFDCVGVCLLSNLGNVQPLCLLTLFLLRALQSFWDSDDKNLDLFLSSY